LANWSGLRDGDRRDPEPQRLDRAAHSGVRDEQRRVLEHVELRLRARGLHAVGQRAELGRVDLARGEHEPVLARELLDAEPVEARVVGVRGPQRDVDQRTLVARRRLPVTPSRRVDAGPGEHVARVDAVGVGLQHARDQHDARLRPAEKRVGVELQPVGVEPRAQRRVVPLTARGRLQRRRLLGHVLL
jgi:hypothetical protein